MVKATRLPNIGTPLYYVSDYTVSVPVTRVSPFQESGGAIGADPGPGSGV